MRTRTSDLCLATLLAALLAACGAKKSVTTAPVAGLEGAARTEVSAGRQQLSLVQRVADQRLYQKNIVGDMTFSIRAGAVSQSLPGSLHMRRDEVIRLQVFIPLLGTEVGRVEFTPARVLVVDRLHKEYIEADYTQLGFLRDNGLGFYSLQSLFWNELLLPGAKKVGEGDLRKFSAAPAATGATTPVTLAEGKMRYQWNVETSTSRILSAVIEYLGGAASSLTWQYADFRPVGVKQFPATQSFSFATALGGKRQEASVTLRMSGVGTGDKWDATTTLSAKYKRVEATDVFDKLLKM